MRYINLFLVIVVIISAPACFGAEKVQALPPDAPFISIIIDDLGEQLPTPKKGFIQKLLALGGDPDFTLTAAVLPQATNSRKIARLASESGFEVIIHQPMEPGPHWKWKLDPGTIKDEMTDSEITELVEKHIKRFPQAAGMNNHMGSLLTSKRDKISLILKILSRHGLYFIDSRTTDDSACAEAASAAGVQFGERNGEGYDTFLDADDADIIIGRIRALADKALKDPSGSYIGIIHPKPGTIRALEEIKPDLKLLGVAVRPAGWSTELVVDTQSREGADHYIMNGIWEEVRLEDKLALTPSGNNPDNWASITVFFNISMPGKYSVSVRNPKVESVSTEAVGYAVYNDGGISRGTYRQEVNRSRWEQLGIYGFEKDESAIIYLKVPLDGYFQGARLSYRGEK